ncbi:MAG: hypothetical protein PHV17_06815 [Candidatus Omnitrophica bacterium]|nr:hypothetical protein [Candidatus Omnitrophota bacterium]
MKDKKVIIEQSKLAFDFVQKLYFETSYLIKEIEGMLAEEEEKFVIGKPAGSAISARTSRGLEATNVSLWTIRKLAVFYIPEVATQTRGGQTFTKFGDKLKLIYFRVILNEKDLEEPYLLAGVFYEINNKTKPNNWPQKFENVMGHLEYNESKVFHKLDPIRYEDPYIKFKGKLFSVNLFDIKDSAEIQKKIIKPALKLFRAI